MGNKQERASKAKDDPGLIPAIPSLHHVHYIIEVFFFFSNPHCFSQIGRGGGGARWEGPRASLCGNLVLV